MLRIASYNINGITSRLAILLRWLGEFQPDVAAGVDRIPRGWEKTSDHAPVWIEFEV